VFKEPRYLFGFMLLLEVGVLAVVIGLGKVTQAESFGLDIILGCFTTLSGGFVVWAFRDPTPPTIPIEKMKEFVAFMDEMKAKERQSATVSQ
jgi:hypothetical protein